MLISYVFHFQDIEGSLIIPISSWFHFNNTVFNDQWNVKDTTPHLIILILKSFYVVSFHVDRKNLTTSIQLSCDFTMSFQHHIISLHYLSISSQHARCHMSTSPKDHINFNLKTFHSKKQFVVLFQHHITLINASA